MKRNSENNQINKIRNSKEILQQILMKFRKIITYFKTVVPQALKNLKELLIF